MKTKTLNIGTVPLAAIVPDKNQPRKYFDSARLSELSDSIQRLGIMNPLIVEKTSDGKYLLVDGERRYHAAKLAGLKEVPVNVVEKLNDTERAMRQFHIQEQHENWTASEKAVAIAKLAEQLGTKMEVIGKQLGIPGRTLSYYIAFAQLVNKDAFQQNQTPIRHASSMAGLKGTARYVSERSGLEFTAEDEEALENATITRIKHGEIRKDADYARIRDTFRRDPKAIRRFIKEQRTTVLSLYKSSKAEPQTYMRQMVNSCNGVISAINKGERVKFEEMFAEAPASRSAVRRAAEDLVRFARKIG